MASPVNVKFAPTIYTVSEDDGFATLTLMSDRPVDMNYTVIVITQDRNATSKYIYVCTDVCMYVHWHMYVCTLVATSKRLTGICILCITERSRCDN